MYDAKLHVALGRHVTAQKSGCETRQSRTRVLYDLFCKTFYRCHLRCGCSLFSRELLGILCRLRHCLLEAEVVLCYFANALPTMSVSSGISPSMLRNVLEYFGFELHV